jgi:hypothetical protein
LRDSATSARREDSSSLRFLPQATASPWARRVRGTMLPGTDNRLELKDLKTPFAYTMLRISSSLITTDVQVCQRSYGRNIAMAGTLLDSGRVFPLQSKHIAEQD